MKAEEPINAEEPITDYNQLDVNGSYTYADYMRWYFSERVELIRGKIRKMSPAPNVRHQSISRNLSGELFLLLKNQPCKFFAAPFDVRLPINNPKNGKASTIVQPDICVICNEGLLDEQGCNGAPDIVIEILSPGNGKYEMDTKFDLYQESGVKEYWIVETDTRAVLVYTLKEGLYIGLRPFTEGTIIESQLFPDLKIAVSDIFRDIKGLRAA
jgi:Uma2 family endonuclease